MLSEKTKQHLAKAMSLALEDNHELMVLDFDRAPEDGESGVNVLSTMAPERAEILAREALGYFAQPNLIVN